MWKKKVVRFNWVLISRILWSILHQSWRSKMRQIFPIAAKIDSTQRAFSQTSILGSHFSPILWLNRWLQLSFIKCFIDNTYRQHKLSFLQMMRIALRFPKRMWLHSDHSYNPDYSEPCSFQSTPCKNRNVLKNIFQIIII